MPWRVPTACKSCGTRTSRGDLCEACKAPPRERPSAAARGYDGEWRRLRVQVLAEEPNCRQCGRPAQHVDHITPLREGGTHERSNLQGLCHPCHSRLTARYDGGFGNPRKEGKTVD